MKFIRDSYIQKNEYKEHEPTHFKNPHGGSGKYQTKDS
ncbi:hypothetical protein LEP1GSC017_1033 [Leptospira meyeri serovar Hardjo str. Went 5]|nr:hypothetical protein LEP1GSC017_1033 [Leptospira meyeri serovar Hardjo str. Went 5]